MEVWQGTQIADAWSWEDEDEEDDEEEEDEQADIKSNNPHLTGGEQQIHHYKDTTANNYRTSNNK